MTHWLRPLPVASVRARRNSGANVNLKSYNFRAKYNPGHFHRSVLAHGLHSEAGRAVWEEEFCRRHLAALSGEAPAVTQRLKAFNDDLRGAGEVATFAAELLGETESGGEGYAGKIKEVSNP